MKKNIVKENSGDKSPYTFDKKTISIIVASVLVVGIVLGGSILKTTEESGNVDDGYLADAFLVKVPGCTATIISDNWLLSAAHCFEEALPASSFSIPTKYGDSELDLVKHQLPNFYATKRKALQLNDTSGWSRTMEQQDEDLRKNDDYWRKIEKVIVHKKYISQGLAWQGFDLALIKLEIKNGKQVPKGLIMPACLPSKDFDDYNNDSLLMAGYGRRRIPHCLTNEIGPERFEVCGRDDYCSKDHTTRRCTLNFLDYNGNLRNSCIANSASPSKNSKDCKDLHNLRPDLMNTTVHLFVSNTDETENLVEKYEFLKTCYPAFSNGNSKGWCTTRKQGIYEDQNQQPQPNSGWGFCSTDASQEYCNKGKIKSFKRNDTPHKVTFFSDEHCLQQLERNLRVDQPGSEKGFEEKMPPLGSFCTGKIYEHSFANEKFILKRESYPDISYVTHSMKVKIFNHPSSKAQPYYVDGGPACFGDSGGPLWREVFDKKLRVKVPVLVGVFSYLLWGTCHGSQDPKYYVRVTSITDWIKQYVPNEEICEYSSSLDDHRSLEPIECIFSEWTEWSDVNPTAKPSYYDTYAYDTPDYDYESDYEDATTTSDCTCKQIEVENKTAVNELQFRSRSLIKEGTIGGDFCDESATDVQKCICGNDTVDNGVIEK